MSARDKTSNLIDNLEKSLKKTISKQRKADIEYGYLMGTKEQHKIDVEDRFGSINHIQSVLNSIISNAETMTSGNVAHHRASIKLLAEGLLNYIKKGNYIGLDPYAQIA